MRSSVSVVATLLVALLTVVRSEMNSSFVDGTNLHRDGRVTVNFGENADSPMTINSNSDVKNSSVKLTPHSNSDGITVNFRSVQPDPSIVPKPQEPGKLSNLTRPKRYCVGNVDAKNSVIFKKRGAMNINSTDEEHSDTSDLTRTERGCQDIYGTKNLAVFRKRGTVDSNSTGEPHMSERAYVANINSEKTVVFKKRGTVDSNSTGESHMSERAYVANINSEKTVVFKKRGTIDSNSTGESHMSERAVIGTFNSVNSSPTAAHSPILGDNKKPLEPSNVTINKRAVVGNINSKNTVVFKKRGFIPLSSDMGESGQLSQPAGSVNGSLST